MFIRLYLPEKIMVILLISEILRVVIPVVILWKKRFLWPKMYSLSHCIHTKKKGEQFLNLLKNSN